MPCTWHGYDNPKQSRFVKTRETRKRPTIGSRVVIPFTVEGMDGASEAYYPGKVVGHRGKNQCVIKFDTGEVEEHAQSKWLTEDAFNAVNFLHRLLCTTAHERWEQLLDLPIGAVIFAPLSQTPGDKFTQVFIADNTDKRGIVVRNNESLVVLQDGTEWYTPVEHEVLSPRISRIPRTLMAQRGAQCYATHVVVQEQLLKIREASDKASKSLAAKVDAFGLSGESFAPPASLPRKDQFAVIAQMLESMQASVTQLCKLSDDFDQQWMKLLRNKPVPQPAKRKRLSAKTTAPAADADSAPSAKNAGMMPKIVNI